MTPRRFERKFIRLAGLVHGEERIYFAAAWSSLRHPGLALHVGMQSAKPFLELGWTISHERSGTALVTRLPAIAAAVSVLDEIGPLCDWRCTARVLDQLAERDSIIRRVNTIAARLNLPGRSVVGPVSAHALKSSAMLSAGVS